MERPFLVYKIPNLDQLDNVFGIGIDILELHYDVSDLLRQGSKSPSYQDRIEALFKFSQKAKRHGQRIGIDFGITNAFMLLNILEHLDDDVILMNSDNFDPIILLMAMGGKQKIIQNGRLSMETDHFHGILEFIQSYRYYLENFATRLKRTAQKSDKFAYCDFTNFSEHDILERISLFQVDMCNDIHQREYFVAKRKRVFTASEIFSEFFTNFGPAVADISDWNTPNILEKGVKYFSDAAGYQIVFRDEQHAKEMVAAFHELYPADKYDPPELR